MRQLFAILAAALMALTPEMGVAQGLLRGDGSNPTNTTLPPATGLGGSAYVPVQVTTPTTDRTEAMLTNAEDAAEQQDNGQMMAYITAGIMAGVAAATCPACSKRGTCGVCAASLLGAAAAALTGSQMGKAENISQQQAYDVNPVDVADPAAAQQAQDAQYNKVVKDLHAAAKAGDMKLAKDLSKLTTPDGRTISTSGAITNPAGSGMSPSEQTALASALKKAQDQAAEKVGKDGTPNAADVLEEFAGGGGNSGRTVSQAVADATNGAGQKDRVPASVAGAYKDFNGEKIGVAADSMFLMMHRRYKFHGEEKQSFMMTAQ